MVYLAFPSLGKTPLALKSGKYLDLDFGHFREAFNLGKDKEDTLIQPFAALVRKYENDGFIVLINDPKLIRTGVVTKVFLPKVVTRAAKKLRVPEDTANQWVQDWFREAEKYHLPVTFLDRGLDHYLLCSGKTRTGRRNSNAKEEINTRRDASYRRK